jgi:hypothetical protein
MGEMGSGCRVFDRLPLRAGDDPPLGARTRRRLIAEIIRQEALCDNIGDHRNGRALMFFRSARCAPAALAGALLTFLPAVSEMILGSQGTASGDLPLNGLLAV